jgi:Centromere DNA-binding protein complex CBF3 subunit, domain 2
MGAFRNKDPFICPLRTLGFYLLYRWDLTDEPFPDFTERLRWYNTPLLFNLKATSTAAIEPLSYSTQLDWTSKIFKLIGLNTTKKTHLFRAAGAKLAELKGVTEDQIARAGRWNYNQMTDCYLTSLPQPFMRKMAGHPI